MYTLVTAASSSKTNHVKHRAMPQHLRATTGHNCIKQLTDSEPSANRQNMTTVQVTECPSWKRALGCHKENAHWHQKHGKTMTVALGPCGAAQPGRFRVVPRPDPQHLSPFNVGLCHYHTRAHPQQEPHRRSSKVVWSLAGEACSTSELLLWLQPMAPAPSLSYPAKCAACTQACYGGHFPTPWDPLCKGALLIPPHVNHELKGRTGWSFYSAVLGLNPGLQGAGPASTYGYDPAFYKCVS